MILLAGLGNPGVKYEKNRHNVGFMAADQIAQRHGFGPWRSRFNGEVAEGRLGAEKCLLLKPTTYMNDSGQAVGEAVRFYKIPLQGIIVFHDELDLTPGKIKVKTGGGHAGNNGLRSIIQHLGAEFRRVRIGIGHPGQKHLVANYVLHDFAKDDYSWLDPLLAAIADAAPRLAEGDDARFMTDIALATGADTRREAKKKGAPNSKADKVTPPKGAREDVQENAKKDEDNKQDNNAPATALGEMLNGWGRSRDTDNG